MGPDPEQRNSTGRSMKGGLEENVKVRDIVVPRLQPEQQIRLEEEVQMPPRREPRRNEGHQPRGPRAMTDESV